MQLMELETIAQEGSELCGSIYSGFCPQCFSAVRTVSIHIHSYTFRYIRSTNPPSVLAPKSEAHPILFWTTSLHHNGYFIRVFWAALSLMPEPQQPQQYFVH